MKWEVWYDFLLSVLSVTIIVLERQYGGKKQGVRIEKEGRDIIGKKGERGKSKG